MRFFQEYNGFIFEFNSVGEYLKAVLLRIVGTIIGFAILGFMLFLLYLLGTSN